MHTKGPWVKNGLHFYGKDGKKVIVSDGPAFGSASNFEDAKDNSSLILAAPELLEALEGLVEEFGKLTHSLGYEYTHMKDALKVIAKAKGEVK